MNKIKQPSWPSRKLPSFRGGGGELGTEGLQDCHTHSDKGRQQCIVQCSEVRVCVTVAAGFALSVLTRKKCPKPGLFTYFQLFGVVFFTRTQVFFSKICVNSSVKQMASPNWSVRDDSILSLSSALLFLNSSLKSLSFTSTTNGI